MTSMEDSQHLDYIKRKMIEKYNLKDDVATNFELESCFNMSTSIITYGDQVWEKEKYLYDRNLPRECCDDIYDYMKSQFISSTPVGDGYCSSTWKQFSESEAKP